MTGTSQYNNVRKCISPVTKPMRKAAQAGMFFRAYSSGRRANQISQSNPIFGKAPVSSRPLMAANSMFFK